MIDLERWEIEASALDDKVTNALGNLASILPVNKKLPAKFFAFESHLMYIILKFLSEDVEGGNTQELFIQIPVEDFVNRSEQGDDSLQDLAFQCFMGAIEACLQLSTIKSYWSKVKLPNNITYRGDNSDWYCEGDMFLAFKEDGECHVVSCAKNTHGELMLQYSVGERKANSSRLKSRPKSGLKSGLCCYHRTKCPFDYSRVYRILPRQSYSEKEVEVICKQIDAFERMLALAESHDLPQFSKAAFIHPKKYGPINDKLITYPNFFQEFVVDKVDINELKLNDGADLIVACGNDNYKNKLNHFRNKRPKKIIFIGTETPGGDIPSYEFTYREIYRYCATQKSLHLEAPVVSEIQFPWMTEAIEGLKALLHCLTDLDSDLNEVYRNVVNTLISFWSDKDFCQALWEEKKSVVLDKLANILEHCSQDTINQILTWVENLKYSSDTNPKKDYIHKIFDDYSKSYNILELGKYDSYKRKIERLNGYKNLIIIDRASQLQGNDKAYSSAYKYTLYRSLFAKVFGLYYAEEFPYLQRLNLFLERELKCYSSDVRKRFETVIMATLIDDQVNRGDVTTLDDLLDVDGFDVGFWKQTDRSAFTVTFVNGESVTLDGNVIVNLDSSQEPQLQRVSISDLCSEQNGTGVYIYYYQKPNNFDELMKIYSELPKEQSVEKLSKVWQDALKSYIDTYSENEGGQEPILNKIVEQTSIKRSILDDYLKDNNERLFFRSKKDMRRMCDFLVTSRQMSRDEARYVLAARLFHQRYSEFGKQLKDELLAYKMGENPKPSMISKIVNNSNFTLDDLMNMCIREGKVKSIYQQ